MHRATQPANAFVPLSFMVIPPHPPGTYSIDQLSHHAVPGLCVRVPGSVFAITDNLESIGVAHMLGDLRSQLHAVALVAVVALKLVGILFKHHIRIFLVEKQDRGCGLRVQLQVGRTLTWHRRMLPMLISTEESF